MASNISISGIQKPKTVKDAIIFILSKEWPLTTKMVYNRIRKNSGLCVSYQAVHKAIKQLSEELVIIRNGKDCSLNQDWLSNKENFYKTIKEKIARNAYPSNEELWNKDLTKLEFDNLYDFYVKILDFSRYIAGVPHYHYGYLDGPCSCLFHHMYWILLMARRGDDQIRYIMEHSPDSYFICKGNTPADNLISKYFIDLGGNVKTGVQFSEVCDIMSGGGFIIQIYFEPDFIRHLDEIYNNFISITDSNLIPLFDEVYHRKTKITVIILKDYKLEEQMYEKIKGYFENGGKNDN